ncbi:hypothetical protein KUV41_10810 [Halomonas sp. DP8Y7-1]|nr:hypothetical protein [Halomonas sp. DP8Y7-1]MBY6029847.1 hypothetical protein [Halomonas sp. DP8Y7-1]
MRLAMQVAGMGEDDLAAAVQHQVIASLESGAFIGLVAVTNDDQIADFSTSLGLSNRYLFLAN